MNNYSMADLEQVRGLLNQADFVLIGAGAGLSASGGLLYADFDTFDSLFPGYYQKYGLTFIYQAAFFDFPTEEEYLAYWARHISRVRLNFPIGEAYFKLKELIRGKSSFVITTNCDGQFYRSGFEQSQLFSPQGDYLYFQCVKPCTNQLFHNQVWVEAMMHKLKPDEFAIATEDVFRCPNCGGRVEPNLRKDYRFVEELWMRKRPAYLDFIENCQNGKLLLIELGVGFNTPGIIRFPFEKVTATHPNAHLIRVNMGNNANYVAEAQSQTLTFDTDITHFLRQW